MESTPPYAALALTITAQDWVELGSGDDPNTAATSDFSVTVERLTALLLVRIVATNSLRGMYGDLSTTTICRSALVEGQKWANPINDKMIEQLGEYISIVLGGYNDVPYHSWQHAYHVVISINKLLDLILNKEIQGSQGRHKPLPPTYGLRYDPLMQMALLFAALVHDVEHTGVPNRQMAVEKGDLALLYNDKSIAENRSLYIAFSLLLKDEFKLLRKAMLPTEEDYFRFRKVCIDVVLATDLASPERTQISKSKWKESFGEEFETVERKVRSELARRRSFKASPNREQPAAFVAARRGTGMTAASILSEMTPLDEYIHETDNEERENDTAGSASITPDVSPDTTPDNSDDENDQDESKKPAAGDLPEIVIDRCRKRPSLEEQGRHSSLIDIRDKRRSIATDQQWNSMRNFIVEEDTEDSLGYSNNLKRFKRRFSTTPKLRHRYRLSIARTIDLDGEVLETYSRGSTPTDTYPRGSTPIECETQRPRMISDGRRMNSGPPDFDSKWKPPGDKANDEDQSDELKLLVVMEQLMAASDVAHNLQGWDQMVKWSSRLFLELKKAQTESRGPDPEPRWYENQIGFLESYLLPLARRLEDILVFGDLIGPVFARIVEANRDLWLIHGGEVTEQTIMEGKRQFPA